jgi:hypothetical protein
MREDGGWVRQAWTTQGTGEPEVALSIPFREGGIPGRRNSGKAILGVPELVRIHYNLPYMKYQPK